MHEDKAVPPPSTSPVAAAEPVADDAAAHERARDAAIVRMRENFQRAYFDFNSFELGEDARAALTENAALMTKFPSLHVQIQGHADDRGTTEFNLTLGQKRAETVSKYLKSLGVAPDRIRTISYGEEKPLVAGKGERIWSKNRRAEFQVLTGKIATVAGTVDDDADETPSGKADEEDESELADDES